MFFTTYYRDLRDEEKDNGFDPILHGEVWRLVTPIFMHGSLLHIFFNMWWLGDLGTMIEVRRGTLRLAGLVLIAAVVSNVGQHFYDGRPTGIPHHSWVFRASSMPCSATSG